MSAKEIIFCLAEDRPDHETGLRLAILSLARHCPASPVCVYKPPTDSGFGEWVRQFAQVTWVPNVPAGSHAWNCKPHALKPLLEEGYRRAVWLDADLVVTRDPRPLFERLDDPTLAVTQEPASLPHQGTATRTRAWSLEVGHALPFTVNSSVVHVTRHHFSLLTAWARLLDNPEYLACQKLPLEKRPIHMASDQDILNALVGSGEFQDIPLHVFRSGVDIIHAGGALGYSWGERLRGLSHVKPAFFHATAGKPWLWFSGQPYWSQRTFFSWHRRILQETSPYLHEVRQYRDQLGLDTRWMEWRTATGTCLRLLGFGHFALRGLPLALAASAMETLQSRSRPAEPIGEGVPVFGRRQ